MNLRCKCSRIFLTVQAMTDPFRGLWFPNPQNAVSCLPIYLDLQKPVCPFKNRQYNVGEEFYDGCDGVCMCTTNLRVHCQPLRCPRPPTLSACIEWEILESFVAKPPNCCPPSPICKNGESFRAKVFFIFVVVFADIVSRNFILFRRVVRTSREKVQEFWKAAVEPGRLRDRVHVS